MEWTIWMFLTVLIVAFAITMIAAGIFSAYFGKGKNRSYGIGITLIGIVVLLFWLWLVIWSDIEPFCAVDAWDTVLNAIISLVAILVGLLAAVGVFLVTVLKS